MLMNRGSGALPDKVAGYWLDKILQYAEHFRAELGLEAHDQLIDYVLFMQKLTSGLRDR